MANLLRHSGNITQIQRDSYRKEHKELKEKKLMTFRLCVLCTTVRKNHAIPTRFLPQKNAKSTEIRTYGVFIFVRGMSVRGMEEGLVWTIPLTIIPLTSLRPCPSSVGHLHVHLGCGWPRWVIRGSVLVGCGFTALCTIGL
jgi:hypothetical protein